MSATARKFNFKMKEEETTNVVNETPVLKFHRKASSESISTEENLEKNNKFTFKISNESEKKQIKRRKYNSELYFGVKNHIDLFEIGKYYTGLLNQGMKSFGLYAGGQMHGVHHSMVGLAAFFNYHKELKATLVIEKFQSSELAKIIKPTHVELEEIPNMSDEDLLEMYACDGIEIIELEKLRHLAFKMGQENFQEFLDNKISQSEIIFWEIPNVEKIDKEREFYLPMISKIQSLSFVVESGKTKVKDLKSMNQYLSKYQILVEGVLMYKSIKG